MSGICLWKVFAWNLSFMQSSKIVYLCMDNDIVKLSVNTECYADMYM